MATPAATPRPSAIPPLAITGISSRSTACGTSTVVASKVTCPPPSQPFTIMTSAPASAAIFASSMKDAFTTILHPTLCQISKYFLQSSGSRPAIVSAYMTGDFSSNTIFVTCSKFGGIMITFIPNGLSVSFLVSAICSRINDSGANPTPSTPSPPALETAATSGAVEIHAIGP